MTHNYKLKTNHSFGCIYKALSTSLLKTCLPHLVVATCKTNARLDIVDIDLLIGTEVEFNRWRCACATSVMSGSGNVSILHLFFFSLFNFK